MTAPADPPVVRLRNGAEVAKPLVAGIMIALRRLLDSYPVALYELHRVARDPGHRMFGGTGQACGELGLAELEDGRWQARDGVRDVILSAVAGEGAALRLQGPVAP